MKSTHAHEVAKPEVVLASVTQATYADSIVAWEQFDNLLVDYVRPAMCIYLQTTARVCVILFTFKQTENVLTLTYMR